MKKNDKYWDAKSVKLDTVTFNVVKEEAPRMQMFEGKQLDAAGARGEYLDKYKKLADNKELVYEHGNVASESYEFFNTQDPSKLFTNAKVRLAFSLALDREAFVQTVVKRGIPAYGWTSFAVASGDQEYRAAVPEPLKALKDKDPKELLKQGLQELGMDPNAPITVNYLSSGTDAVSRSFAEFDQNQWQTKLGVTVKLDAVSDFAQFQDKINNLEYQIAGMGWGADYNDPMTFLDMFTTGNGNNNGKWSNAEYDKLIEQVSHETDFKKRTEIFAKAEQLLLVDDCAIAPTYYRDKNTFIHPYVKGLQLPLFAADYEAKYAYTEGRP
jgi:oligopeptide transport system substrate-binding protein